MMQVSHSQLACFRRCPREHHYRYVDRVEPVTVAEVLTTGKAIHAAMGAWHRGEASEPWTMLEKPLERALMRGYVSRWVNAPLQMLRTDVPFTVEIGGVQVVGELDGIARTSDGEVVIVEHKTTSEDIAPGSAYWRRVIHVDAQVSTYLYASKVLGLGAERIVYDVARKPALRGKKSETDADLEVRALDDIAARPEHYYSRALVTRLEDDHRAHERDVSGVVRLMLAGESCRNTDSCFKFGRECDFFSVCFEGGSIHDESRFRARVARKGDFSGEGRAASGSGVRAAGDRENDTGRVDSGGADSRLGPGGGPDERTQDRRPDDVDGELGAGPRYQF